MDLDNAITNQIGVSTLPETVEELVLDTVKATKVTGLDKFTNLKTLTLNGCGLTTLEGFPTLPKLMCLELSDNQLSGGLEELQECGLFQLSRLSLAGNRFATLDSLQALDSLPALKDLDLYNCPVTEVASYRSGIFEMLPSLKYLDGFDENENEKDDDDDDDDGEGDDDDLLSSEVGEDEEDDIGEDDDDLGEEGEDFGEDEDFGEEGEDFGEDGEEGEEGEEDGEEDGGEDEEEDMEAAAAAKRQRR